MRSGTGNFFLIEALIGPAIVERRNLRRSVIEWLWLSHNSLDMALHQSSRKIKGKHLILEFCECLLLRNGFNMNILHYMWDFNLKKNSSMGIYDVIFFLRGVYLYISQTLYFSLVKFPQNSWLIFKNKRYKFFFHQNLFCHS